MRLVATDNLAECLHEADETIARLVREKEAVEGQRDRYRTDALDAVGYGADHLVHILCTVPDITTVAAAVSDFADRLEQIALGITPVSAREQGSAAGFGEALAEVREMLAGD